MIIKLIINCIFVFLNYSYHQKVPVDAPQLELKATYGLVAPEEFTPPEPSPLWTAEAYKSFDISRLPPLDPVR